MKKTSYLLLISLFASISTNAAINEKVAADAKAVCLAAFDKSISGLYNGTNAESVRMSRRINFKPVEAESKAYFLAEVEGNFYVKWPDNKGEVPELAGANMVYSVATKSCKSVGLYEFLELKK